MVASRLARERETSEPERGNRYRAGEREERPWGSWEVLALGEAWCLKRLDIRPGHILSLQSHEHRDEAWVVAEGVARVTVGERVSEHGAGETVLVPRRTRHRIANPRADALTLVEVQTGDLLDETDTRRFEDAYGRAVLRDLHTTD